MTQRRLYLDVGCGQSRGVVTLDGRPERLLIARDGDDPRRALGAGLVARVRKVEAALALAFLDLGDGEDAVLNLTRETGRPVEGQAVEVEIRAEGRAGKGPVVRLIGPGEGPPRLLRPAPGLEAQLRAFDKAAEVEGGAAARAMADAAEDEALETAFPLPGGGTLFVERTRALTAVDVDLGAGQGGDSKRAARVANLAALAETARVLRLKGLGGLVVVDFVGRGPDAVALLAQARGVFAPDNPGVAIGPVSRFGTLEATIPRRARPTVEILADADGRRTVLTLGLAVLRDLEREAIADRGGRFEAVVAPEVAAAAGPALPALTARVGGRVALRAERGRARESFLVRPL